MTGLSVQLLATAARTANAVLAKGDGVALGIDEDTGGGGKTPARIKPVRRALAVAAVAGALAGGAVAGGVSAASADHGRDGSTAPSSSGTGSLSTAAVVRTDLVTPVQVGGSIGYEGSYTITAPSGSSAQQLTQAQQAVTKDQQTLSADETAGDDATAADDQTVSSALSNVDAASSTLSADQAKEAHDCAGTSASSPACAQDASKVGQDQSVLTQAQQQLASAASGATRDRDQNEAKVASDRTQLQDDEAAVASLQPSVVGPGTTYTWLPRIGDVITEDQTVYSVSDQRVPLLYGPVAAYRAFYVGMPDGADVGELTRDLIALGFGSGLAQGDHFGPSTARAAARWQAALGLPATGQVWLGQVVFEPGPIRVTTVSASVGATIGGGGGGGGSGTGGGGDGAVLTATSTTPIVTVELDVTQEYLVKGGDAVSIVLPDGVTTVGGRVESVGNVATCPGGGATGTASGSSPGSGTADQSPCEAAGSGSASTPTVTVTITLDSTPPGATLDQAPVNVDITSQRVDSVLAVPVNSLLALQGGGFGVEVVDGGTSRLVGVTTGLYADTLVQVSGTGIAAGTRVEVPSS